MKQIVIILTLVLLGFGACNYDNNYANDVVSNPITLR